MKDEPLLLLDLARQRRQKIVRLNRLSQRVVLLGRNACHGRRPVLRVLAARFGTVAALAANGPGQQIERLRFAHLTRLDLVRTPV
jgi:hypothetical protein